MIRSMTGFANAQVQSAHGTLALELRSVNNRHLDLNFRLPEDLRIAEAPLRERLARELRRGKIDIRANYSAKQDPRLRRLDEDLLHAVAEQLAMARRHIPDLQAPGLHDLLALEPRTDAAGPAPEILVESCLQACELALAELQAAREREGARLAAMMAECGARMKELVTSVEAQLPELLAEHAEKLASRLREALESAWPAGFAHISGEELSARIAQETSLFSLRIDVAEEVSRLRSHLEELDLIIGTPHAGAVGKRLDFLFQEMNREANTLGSKSANILVTRAAIDLKLLIEQMREQAQNIE